MINQIVFQREPWKGLSHKALSRGQTKPQRKPALKRSLHLIGSHFVAVYVPGHL
jgi:hypothetical protein